jgi:hypothetical protein
LAVVAVLAFLAAVLGCWALRVEVIGAPQAETASPVAAPATSHGRFSAEWATVCRPDLDSTVNDDKAFKSAGLKRDRQTTFSIDVPRSSGSAMPSIERATRWQQPGDAASRAPTTVVADQNRLIQFCVDRR